VNRVRSRRECEALVAALRLPTPFDLAAMCTRVGEQRGKPIVLMATPMSMGGGLCGMWMGTAQADYVFYEQDTTVVHQQHIVFHELGHILRRHPAARLLGTELAASLALHVDTGDEAPRVLGRDAYTDDHEYEAELIATFILRRLGTDTDSTHGTREAVDPNSPLSRVERSLRRPGR
jgi:hypothetical protein